jgi:hypothetical protein
MIHEEFSHGLLVGRKYFAAGGGIGQSVEYLMVGFRTQGLLDGLAEFGGVRGGQADGRYLVLQVLFRDMHTDRGVRVENIAVLLMVFADGVQRFYP